MSASTTRTPAQEVLLEEAEGAYDRQDQSWFNRQTTQDLTFMWEIACDINQGACWDDEVYDALAARGHFDEPSTASTSAAG